MYPVPNLRVEVTRLHDVHLDLEYLEWDAELQAHVFWCPDHESTVEEREGLKESMWNGCGIT